jgi:hypothetical protein
MKLWKPILVAALVAGVLDLIYAVIHIGGYYDMMPMQIFQSIARGVLGPATTEGGWGSASLGLFLEFVLTAIMAAVYIIPAQWITDLRKFWWLLGPCYGIVVMVVMYVVVLPLSAVHGSSALPDSRMDLMTCRPFAAPPDPSMFSVELGSGPHIDPRTCRITDHQMLYGTIFAHMILVGLVVSACARFLWPKEETAEAR